MYLSSQDGRRSISVSAKTLDRAITHITDNPGKTPSEYAEATQTAVVTINLVIQRYLMHMVAAGRIAASDRGAKPDWYYMTTDSSIVPIRKKSKRALRPTLPGIVDPQLRRDYAGLVGDFDVALHRTMSPAKRTAAIRVFLDRVVHVGSNHQDTIDNAGTLVMRLEAKMQGMEEAIQVMATAMTSMTMKVAA
jgi:hypothetical protein